MLIIFDTETTGLVENLALPLDQQPSIIEFAAIKLDKELKEVDRIEFLCNPMRPISDKITTITGIKASDVEDKKPFVSHFQELCDFFLGSTHLIAHNVDFDASMLLIELMRMGKQHQFPWPYTRICTVAATAYLKGKRLNLTELHELATGETFAGAHRAIVDVEALTRCVRRQTRC